MFLALSIVAPAQIQKAETRVFSNGLKISVEKTSPAYAALQDELVNPIEVPREQKIQKVVSVSAGESFVWRATQIEASNKLEAEMTLQRQMAAAPKAVVAEISREELMSLFLPIVTTLKKEPPVQTKIPHTQTTVSVAKYEVHKTDSAAKPVQTITPDSSVDENQPHMIRGLIEFRDGLALTSPNDQVTVFQEVEGDKWEEGTVWLRDARYAIEVPNRQGLLVAELRSVNGELMGRGEIELANLPLKKQTQYKVTDITIELHPITSGIAGSILSAYSHEDVKRPVDQARVSFVGVGHELETKKDGSFEDSQLMDGSNAIVEVQAPGFWKSLGFVNSKALNEITIYPNKMLRAFFSFVKEANQHLHIENDSALVWGKITHAGKSLAGAHVELMTTEEPIKPIYFNELMIPDASLTATSSNGLYAFVNVPAGAHAIQVTDGGVLSEPIVFPTEALHVSTINIETVNYKKMTLKAFDAFSTETQVPSDIYRLGFESERVRASGGVAQLKYVPSTSALVVNAVPNSNEYVPARITSARNKNYAYFPMLKTKWLKQMIAGRRTQGTSIIVGFVKTNRPYQVHDENGVSTVVYFDAQGNILEGGSGMPGGGYVLFNLSTGYHSLSVAPLGADRISVQTILADTKFVNVVNHVIQ